MADDDISKLEAKIDELRSLIESEPKKSSTREILLIVIAAVVTFVFTTIGQGALSFYSHWQDQRAQLAQLQINTFIRTSALGPAGPAGDINEFMEHYQLLAVMPSGMLNDWANGFGGTSSCENDFARDCLIREAGGVNDIRKSLGLPAIPQETFVKIMQSNGLVDRLNQDVKDNEGS